MILEAAPIPSDRRTASRPNDILIDDALMSALHSGEIRKSIKGDQGIAGQNILLGTTGMGLAGCMIDTVDRERLRRDLRIPDRFEILLVIALGKAKEKLVHIKVFPFRDQVGSFTALRLPVKNPVLPHGASSKEKAIWAIHPRSSGRGILAFSRKLVRIVVEAHFFEPAMMEGSV